MADNIKTYDADGIAKNVAFKDQAGVFFQRIINTFAKAGVQTDVTVDDPLPTQMPDGKLVALGSKADALPTTETIADPFSAISFLRAIAKFSLNPVMAAGENHVGEMGFATIVNEQTITRPANTNAYAANTLWHNQASGAVAPVIDVSRLAGGTTGLNRLRASVSNPSGVLQVRYHFYRLLPVAPTPANAGDGLAFSGVFPGVGARKIGYTDITLDDIQSDGKIGYSQPLGWLAKLDTVRKHVFWLPEVRNAYTPVASETMRLTVEASSD